MGLKNGVFVLHSLCIKEMIFLRFEKNNLMQCVIQFQSELWTKNAISKGFKCCFGLKTRHRINVKCTKKVFFL